MNIYKRIGLFLSSFAPLFLLLVFKELTEILNGNWSFNFLNTSVLVVLLFFLSYGIIYFYIILKEVKIHKNKCITIISKENVTDDHFLGYFSLFVLFALSFEIEMYSMAGVFFIVLIFIGIVYIKNNMFYINPLINILGYSFYDIKYKLGDENKTHSKRVFFKGKLETQKKYVLKDKYSSFIFLTKIK